MKGKLFILIHLACWSAFSPLLSAQTPCDCQSAYRSLLEKIEEDYIGFALQRKELEERYGLWKEEFNEKIEHTGEESCVSVLQDFLRFFEDGHLFALELPKPPAEEIEKSKARVRGQRFDLERVTGYLAAKREFLETLEGLWTDGQSRFAILQNPRPKWDFQYVAVILTSQDQEKAGEIKFGVNFANDRYEGIYYTDSYVPRYTSVEPAKGDSLLNIWGGILWKRLSFSDKTSLAQAPMSDPNLPTVERLGDQTTLLTLPSFLLDKKDFDQVLQAESEALRQTVYLIIDIRGNTGGNGIYFDLLRLYAEKPLISRVGWALASEDNIAYFQRFAGGGAEDPYQPVVKEMQANMGKVVKGPRFAPTEFKTIPSRIQKVAILTDGANMSAAETFVLFSKAISNKVVTIGRNTAGVVDYNNVNIIRLTCEARGIYLGYPTFTLNDRIPEDGYNKTGIRPDVVTSKQSTDLIRFAADYLRNPGRARRE